MESVQPNPPTSCHVTNRNSDVKECVTSVDVRVFTSSPPIKPILIIHLHALSSVPLLSLSETLILSLNLFTMQQALPYRTWLPTTPSSSATAAANSAGTRLQPSNAGVNSVKIGTSAQKLVAENAVIVFGRRGCCMCHVVKRLLVGLGVNPPVVEVDDQEELAVIEELSKAAAGGGQEVQFPAVFVGGKLFGGLERVMATHITGELVPVLKEAGALWL